MSMSWLIFATDEERIYHIDLRSIVPEVALGSR